MLIDHIGIFFFPNILALRIIGRISFPIFAFFVAEGFFYTHSKKRYLITMLIFAIVSQVPYMFLFGFYQFNILFTFLFAIILLWLFEKIKTTEKHQRMMPIMWFCTLCLFLIIFSKFYSYGILGVLCVFNFYAFRDKPIIKWLLFCTIMVLMALVNAIFSSFTLQNLDQVFGILALPFLLLYNGQKGKINLKYLFYIFYPTHLAIILLLLQII